MTNVIMFFTFVENKRRIAFVNCIICQMNSIVSYVRFTRLSILSCGKSGKSFFIYENSQWISSCYQYVNSKIKLERANKIRFKYVLLYYIVFSCRNILRLSDQKNSLSLTTIFGFDNKSFRLPFELCFQFIKFVGKSPSLRKE